MIITTNKWQIYVNGYHFWPTNLNYLKQSDFGSAIAHLAAYSCSWTSF